MPNNLIDLGNAPIRIVDRDSSRLGLFKFHMKGDTIPRRLFGTNMYLHYFVDADSPDFEKLKEVPQEYLTEKAYAALHGLTTPEQQPTTTVESYVF